MRRHFWIYGFILLFLSLTGCVLSSQSQKPDLPPNDKVLTYPLPMDLAFLRAMEALEKIPDWELEATEKEKGWIRIRNLNYSRFDDADKRLIMVLLKQEERNKVSIQIAPESQRVLGGDLVLKAIDELLKKEVAKRTPVSPAK